MDIAEQRRLALDRVLRAMDLRRPQKEALQAFADAYAGLSKRLSEVSNEDVVYAFRDHNGAWDFPAGFPELTFCLATGVGKTRLIGALMAYLYLAGESSHFAVVTPRGEVVRKFLRETRAEDPKYIFCDRTLVEEPRVVYMDSRSSDAIDGGLFGGPVLWIMTPQALANPDAKMKRRDERSLMSPWERLRRLKDLVVFFDESHHLGIDPSNPSMWRNEVRELQPRFVLGTSASVPDPNTANTIYIYSLQTCMNEHLYTKMVRILGDEKDKYVTDEEHDKTVLRFGLMRLALKQSELDDYSSTHGGARPVKAVMLVCCVDQGHANDTAAWLKTELKDRSAVLLVHSGVSGQEYLESLLDIENQDNPVKVVVNVSMLTEGWDVSNIYVIAPLRAMASSVLVTQVMGRGLRLPYGRQVNAQGNYLEVDTLDVLCFGNETMNEICDNMLKGGFGVNGTGGISVEQVPDGSLPVPALRVPSVAYRLHHVRPPQSLVLPTLHRVPERLDLDQVTLPPLARSDIQAFLLHNPQNMGGVHGFTLLTSDRLIDIVATALLTQCTFLSYQLHNEQLRKLLKRLLESSGFTGETVPLEPSMVVAHVRRYLTDLTRQTEAHYEVDEGQQVLNLDGVDIHVPGHFTAPIDSSLVSERNWNPQLHQGVPIGNWVRCAFEAVPFDQKNELKVAKIVDRSTEVQWWFRNLPVPSMLRLSTPAGLYAPDFAVLLQVGEEHVLLEVKGEIFMGETADSEIKAKAAQRWCRAMSDATASAWSYWLLLDRDAAACDSFNDIRQRSEKDL